MVERRTLDLPVGEVLDLANASTAHRMLDGAPHKPGKIVLKVSDCARFFHASRYVMGGCCLLFIGTRSAPRN